MFMPTKLKQNKAKPFILTKQRCFRKSSNIATFLHTFLKQKSITMWKPLSYDI